MRAKFFRTKYFTGSRIQIKYLSLLLVSMIVPSILVGCCLYYLIFTLVAEQIGIPEYIAYNVFPVVNKINVMLIIGIPPLFLLFILWGVILSHRFAGPLERLEKELEEISEDKRHEHRIVLRKNDDIRPIADAINKLLDRMEGRKG
jgi:signal transduction histidine kinase